MWGPSNIGCTHMFDCLYCWSDAPERSLEEATPFLERAVELEPNDPWPRLHLGQVAYFRGDYQEAIRLVEQALDHGVDDPGLGGMGGNILCLAGLTQRAHQVLTAFVREMPHPHWPGYEFLGLCESIAGRYEKALAAFDRQIETVADPTFCYLLKAVPYLKLGQPERARAAVAHAISLRPELRRRHRIT